MLFTVGSDRRAAHRVDRARMLYLIYAGRLSVCLAVYGSALAAGELAGGTPFGEIRWIALSGLILAAAVTPVAYWWSHVRQEEPGEGFLYGQAILDIVLVTGIVHITGGSESVFPPLFYITLASGYALVLPFGSAVLVALATGVAYLGEVALAFPAQLGLPVLLQIGIFTLVASISSVIGGRLRQVRAEVRRLEGELHRLRLGTTDLLRTIDSAVVTLDGEGRLAYMNPAAERLLGREAASHLGEPFLPELDDRAPGLAVAIRESLWSGEGVRNREATVARNDGEEVPVSVSTAVIARSGSVPSITLVLQDLRPVRRLEELRLRATRLEAVAELSASLAHEIRNPLASIRSAVQQLGDRELTDEDDRNLVRLVLRESDRLSTLLEEFGDFARVDVADRRPVELEGVIADVLETVRQHPDTPEDADLGMTVEDDPGQLQGDRELLHRALVNLVLNAVQAGGRDGAPSVRVRVDTLRPDREPGDERPEPPVRIRVEDDGPGIPSDEQERVFDPFYTTREDGSGLGLSIAYRAVQAHGGALMVSSGPEGGASLVVVLPRQIEAGGGGGEPAGATARGPSPAPAEPLGGESPVDAAAIEFREGDER